MHTFFLERKYAPLAQLVEQLTLNQWVLGSSPRRRTKRPVGQVVKTAASHAVNVGSIPAGVTKAEKSIVGVDCHEGPPVPIPNTEVKLVCAEDTLRVTARENR